MKLRPATLGQRTLLAGALAVAAAAAFVTPYLDSREIDEQKGLHQLLSPLSYYSAILERVVTVPAGFVTDFASVPRILGVYDLAGGKCNKAAVIHDWLYSTQCVDRETADRVLREAILASGYGAFTAGVFYAAVHTFGASHWAKPNVPQTANVAQAMSAETAAAGA
jgi:hypothetical protein